MLDNPLGLYQTGSEYPPILLACVTPVLQWTCIYCKLGASLIFDTYFPLMNALHVDWLLIRHQFSLISASNAEARMISPTCIMMALTFFIL